MGSDHKHDDDAYREDDLDRDYDPGPPDTVSFQKPQLYACHGQRIGWYTSGFK